MWHTDRARDEWVEEVRCEAKRPRLNCVLLESSADLAVVKFLFHPRAGSFVGKTLNQSLAQFASPERQDQSRARLSL